MIVGFRINPHIKNHKQGNNRKQTAEPDKQTDSRRELSRTNKRNSAQNELPFGP